MPAAERTPSFRTAYWESTTLLRKAEVIVVGAGLTGLQTALNLKSDNPKRDVLVVERSPIPRGASTRNAGFACFGGPTEILADLEAYGPSALAATVRARYEGIQTLRKNYSERGIDWAAHGGFEIIDQPEVEQKVRTVLPLLNTLLEPITGMADTWRETASLNGLYTLHNPLEAQLHPGKLVTLLLNDCQTAGVRFLFGAEAKAVDRGGVDLGPLGFVAADEVVVTVNAFARGLLPTELGEQIRPVRNQILLSRKFPELKLRGCFHYHEGYVYFRNVGPDRLLIGGARHLAGSASETDRFGPNPEVVGELTRLLSRWFPEMGLGAEDFPVRWSGIIAQGTGKTPILQRAENGVLVAGRLAGMGVALSAALARRAADEIG